MKNILITLVLAILITIAFIACSKFIALDQYQNFTTAFVFGLSFSILFRENFKSLKSKQLGLALGDAVRNAIKKEKQRGGLLGKNILDQSSTDIDSCKQRFKDHKGFYRPARTGANQVRNKWSNRKDE